ncbi:MAG TPA: enoyl-CoA hydratase-related protein [Pseudomonadales bacterium]|nr:enoyl-CoA hydratase-related protein [Pseudomonadales bacterium]
MIDLQREGDVFVLTMNDGENRWNTTFVRAMAAVLDEVEASTGPAALVTASADQKFFSNGLDLDWLAAEGEHRGGDRAVFGAEFMALMGRIITFPMPTVCAINGHAFGAGFMVALCHDVRIMRADRGFACANEMQLGMKIPNPELALFRHKLPMNTFFETVQLARRWTGTDAFHAGIVQQATTLDELRTSALRRAGELAPLGANRELYGGQKERLYGENAVINGVHGPAHMLRHSADFH